MELDYNFSFSLFYMLLYLRYKDMFFLLCSVYNLRYFYLRSIQNCIFSCRDFRDFDVFALTSQDFVYADPPYLITCATYNERGGWSETDEKDLLSFLDELNGRNIRFALSNVLRSKGRENNILVDWLDKNADKYKIIQLNFSYSNSNYQTKDKTSASEEVLIINY